MAQYGKFVYRGDRGSFLESSMQDFLPVPFLTQIKLLTFLFITNNIGYTTNAVGCTTNTIGILNQKKAFVNDFLCTYSVLEKEKSKLL
ncbi:MAG: hypothetical protein KAW12_27580 [Candidatus Aminicenantes bacterium]|nr:hypothetical protein [Candidatus Aminicenantes bacterium]